MKGNFDTVFHLELLYYYNGEIGEHDTALPTAVQIRSWLITFASALDRLVI